MNPRFAVAVAGLVTCAVLGVTACGSDAGTGAAPQTTVRQLGGASYVTQVPILTSTTAPLTDPNAVGIVAGEQKYTIAAGDLVVRIAKKFCIGLDALATYNQWEDGYTHSIFPGDIIKIPPGACAPGTATANSTTATVAAQVPPPATTTTIDFTGYATYVVVAGDYLGGIAKKTGSTVAAIVAANQWPDGDKHNIYPGQKIRIPGKNG
jgi:LysM repeat protein